MGITVAVAGASGYAGAELLRLLAAHPDFEVIAAAAHANAGQPLADISPHLVSYGDLRFVDTTVQTLSEAELVFL
ncbi:MAG: N-acetyl-gamma-glutamyl-phosphate reductase, partial [Pseudonocardiales bacterium]|nr:N-acetyl-gamma-glutamyl-phosphate reductase [Pseudonocardiales bacterium]